MSSILPMTLPPMPQALASVDTETLFVCRPWGNGFEVLNGREQWTPIANFARAFPAEYAHALATRLARDGAYTTAQIEIP